MNHTNQFIYKTETRLMGIENKVIATKRERGRGGIN